MSVISGLKEDSFGLIHGGVDIIRDVDPETRIKDLLDRYQLNESVTKTDCKLHKRVEF